MPHYTIKHTCDVVCWIGPPPEPMLGGGVAGGTGNNISENNGFIVGWNKGKKCVVRNE